MITLKRLGFIQSCKELTKGYMLPPSLVVIFKSQIPHLHFISFILIIIRLMARLHAVNELLLLAFLIVFILVISQTE